MSGTRTMSPVELEWRLRRLSQMSATEVGWRISDHLRRRRWASQQITPGGSTPDLGSSRLQDTPRNHGRLFGIPSSGPSQPKTALQAVPDDARQRVIAAGEQLLAGRWELLGAVRRDMEDPDWFLDPVTGKRAPQVDYCFKVNHRSEDVTGNVKQVWELSRMHHLTVLAAAFALTGDERYAERAASHLRSWWAQNPFLSGVHWTSGIETGLRLIAWVWVRRLLDGWAGVTELFEGNDVALAQIWWHQHYLASFRSRGSSANNHVIAEAAGLLVAALAFDWFAESSRWSEEATGVLEQELARNTFPSGVNREMAFEYHGFVTELAVVAGSGGRLGWAPPVEGHLGVAVPHAQRGRGHGGREPPRTSPGGRRRREGPCPRSPDRRAVVRPARHRRGSVRRARVVAECRVDGVQHPPGVDGRRSPHRWVPRTTSMRITPMPA